MRPKRNRGVGVHEVERPGQKTHRFRGIWFDKNTKRWSVGIKRNGADHRVGGFPKAEQAALAHDRLMLFLGGSKDELNFRGRSLEPASVRELRAEIRTRHRHGVTSGYFGVGLMSDGRHFRASVRVQGRMYNVYGFDSEQEAARARDRLALWARGPGADLNFPDERPRPASFETLHRDRLAARKVHTTSRYRGVYLLPHPNARHPWVAELGRSGRPRKLFLGRWLTERSAAIAVDRATLHYLSDDGKLNVPRRARELGPADAQTLRQEAWREFKTVTTSRYRGVCLDRRNGRWLVHVEQGSRQHYLGTFEVEEEAARAYDRAALKFFGAKARLNFEGAATKGAGGGSMTGTTARRSSTRRT